MIPKWNHGRRMERRRPKHPPRRGLHYYKHRFPRGIAGQRETIAALHKTSTRRSGSFWMYLRHFKETLP